MIAREYRTLSECIRDRCKKTGIGRVLQIAVTPKFLSIFYYNAFLLFFLLRALRHEFVRISRVIIHGLTGPDESNRPIDAAQPLKSHLQLHHAYAILHYFARTPIVSCVPP
jgi:hypothetical protein